MFDFKADAYFMIADSNNNHLLFENSEIEKFNYSYFQYRVNQFLGLCGAVTSCTYISRVYLPK